MKPRIETLSNGLTREAIAEQTHLTYDPATGLPKVSFQYRDSLFLGGEFLSIGGDWQTLMRNVSDIAARCFADGMVDPVTHADLSGVSCAGVVTIIKQAYAALYDEAVAAELAAAQPVEPIVADDPVSDPVTQTPPDDAGEPAPVEQETPTDDDGGDETAAANEEDAPE